MGSPAVSKAPGAETGQTEAVLCRMTPSQWRPGMLVPTYFVSAQPRRGYYRKLRDAVQQVPPYSRIEIAGAGTFRERVVVDRPLEISVGRAPAHSSSPSSHTSPARRARDAAAEGSDRTGPPLLTFKTTPLTITAEEAFVEGLSVELEGGSTFGSSGRTDSLARGGAASTATCAVLILAGKVVMQACSLQAVEVSGKAAPVLRECRLCGGPMHGLLVTDQASGSYTRNTVQGHGGFSVFVDSVGSPVLSYNTLLDSQLGQVCVREPSGEHIDKGRRAGRNGNLRGDVVAPVFLLNRITSAESDGGDDAHGLASRYDDSEGRLAGPFLRVDHSLPSYKLQALRVKQTGSTVSLVQSTATGVPAAACSSETVKSSKGAPGHARRPSDSTAARATASAGVFLSSLPAHRACGTDEEGEATGTSALTRGGAKATQNEWMSLPPPPLAFGSGAAATEEHHYAVQVHGRAAQPTMTRNSVVACRQHGMLLHGGAAGVYQHNTIAANKGWGVVLLGSRKTTALATRSLSFSAARATPQLPSAAGSADTPRRTSANDSSHNAAAAAAQAPSPRRRSSGTPACPPPSSTAGGADSARDMDASDALFQGNHICGNGGGGARVVHASVCFADGNRLAGNRGPQLMLEGTHGGRNGSSEEGVLISFRGNVVAAAGASELGSADTDSALAQDGDDAGAGGGLQSSSTGQVGVWCSGSGIHAELSRNEFDGCGIAVWLTQQANPIFSSNTFDGGAVGVYAGTGATGSFTACNFTDQARAAVVVCGRATTHFDRCRIHGCSVGALITHNGSGAFDACEIVGSRKAAMEVVRGGAPQVTSCKLLSGGTDGLVVGTDGLGVYTSNVMAGHAVAQVRVVGDGADPVVTSCVIGHSPADGVVVEGGALGTFTGNIIRACYGAGVRVTGACSAPVWRGNFISNCGGYGLRVTEGIDGVYERNVLVRCGRACVKVEGPPAAAHARHEKSRADCQQDSDRWPAERKTDGAGPSGATSTAPTHGVGGALTLRRSILRGSAIGVMVDQGARLLLLENTIADHKQSAVTARGCATVSLLRNDISSCADGVMADDHSSLYVFGNVFCHLRRGAALGSFDARHYDAAWNVFQRCHSALQLRGTRGGTVHGNVIAYSHNCGAVIGAGCAARIRQNVFHHNARGLCLAVRQCRARVTDNCFRATVAEAIHVQYDAVVGAIERSEQVPRPAGHEGVCCCANVVVSNEVGLRVTVSSAACQAAAATAIADAKPQPQSLRSGGEDGIAFNIVLNCREGAQMLVTEAALLARGKSTLPDGAREAHVQQKPRTGVGRAAEHRFATAAAHVARLSLIDLAYHYFSGCSIAVLVGRGEDGARVRAKEKHAAPAAISVSSDGPLPSTGVLVMPFHLCHTLLSCNDIGLLLYSPPAGTGHTGGRSASLLHLESCVVSNSACIGLHAAANVSGSPLSTAPADLGTASLAPATASSSSSGSGAVGSFPPSLSSSLIERCHFFKNFVSVAVENGMAPQLCQCVLEASVAFHCFVTGSAARPRFTRCLLSPVAAAAAAGGKPSLDGSSPASGAAPVDARLAHQLRTERGGAAPTVAVATPTLLPSSLEQAAHRGRRGTADVPVGDADDHLAAYEQVPSLWDDSYPELANSGDPEPPDNNDDDNNNGDDDDDDDDIAADGDVEAHTRPSSTLASPGGVARSSSVQDIHDGRQWVSMAFTTAYEAAVIAASSGSQRRSSILWPSNLGDAVLGPPAALKGVIATPQHTDRDGGVPDGVAVRERKVGATDPLRSPPAASDAVLGGPGGPFLLHRMTVKQPLGGSRASFAYTGSAVWLECGAQPLFESSYLGGHVHLGGSVTRVVGFVAEAAATLTDSRMPTGTTVSGAESCGEAEEQQAAPPTKASKKKAKKKKKKPAKKNKKKHQPWSATTGTTGTEHGIRPGSSSHGGVGNAASSAVPEPPLPSGLFAKRLGHLLLAGSPCYWRAVPPTELVSLLQEEDPTLFTVGRREVETLRTVPVTARTQLLVQTVSLKTTERMSGCAVLAKDNAGGVFTRCSFARNVHAAVVSLSSTTSFQHCHFDDQTGDSVRFSGQSTGALRGCVFNEARCSAVRVSGAGSSPRIEDCEFVDTTFTAVELEDRCAPVLTRNRFHSITAEAVRVSCGAAPEIHANSFSRCRVGVAFHDGGGGRAWANTLAACSEAAVSVVHHAPSSFARPVLGEPDRASGEDASAASADGQTAPVLEENAITGSKCVGVWVSGRGAEPTLRHNQLSENAVGVSLSDGAGGSYLCNSLSKHQTALRLDDSGGLFALNLIAEPSVVGVALGGAGSTTVLLRNVILDAHEHGMVISGGDGQLVRNRVSRCGGDGCVIGGGQHCRPLLFGNAFADNAMSGARVTAGARPTLTATAVMRNAGGGVVVEGANTAPGMQGCYVKGNHTVGVRFVNDASGSLDATVISHTIGGPAVVVEEDSHPVLRELAVVANGEGGIAVRGNGCCDIIRCLLARNGNTATIPVTGAGSRAAKDDAVDGDIADEAPASAAALSVAGGDGLAAATGVSRCTRLFGCLFLENCRSILCERGSGPELTACGFLLGSTGGSGAVYLARESSPSFRHCLFAGTGAGGRTTAAAVVDRGSSAKFNRTVFMDCPCAVDVAAGSASLYECEIRAGVTGARVSGGRPSFIGCTISSASKAGLHILLDGQPTVEECGILRCLRGIVAEGVAGTTAATRVSGGQVRHTRILWNNDNVVVSEGSAVSLEQNTIYDAACNGILIKGGGPSIVDNDIFDNHFAGVNVSDGAVLLPSAKFEGNNVSFAREGGALVVHSNAARRGSSHAASTAPDPGRVFSTSGNTVRNSASPLPSATLASAAERQLVYRRVENASEKSAAGYTALRQCLEGVALGVLSRVSFLAALAVDMGDVSEVTRACGDAVVAEPFTAAEEAAWLVCDAPARTEPSTLSGTANPNSSALSTQTTHQRPAPQRPLALSPEERQSVVPLSDDPLRVRPTGEPSARIRSDGGFVIAGQDALVQTHAWLVGTAAADNSTAPRAREDWRAAITAASSILPRAPSSSVPSPPCADYAILASTKRSLMRLLDALQPSPTGTNGAPTSALPPAAAAVPGVPALPHTHSFAQLLHRPPRQSVTSFLESDSITAELVLTPGGETGNLATAAGVQQSIPRRHRASRPSVTRRRSSAALNASPRASVQDARTGRSSFAAPSPPVRGAPKRSTNRRRASVLDGDGQTLPPVHLPPLAAAATQRGDGSGPSKQRKGKKAKENVAAAKR